MERVTYSGVTLNTRTRDMLQAAEYVAGLKFLLAQGSYNAGGVTASAGTHDGGGAVDVDVVKLSPAKRTIVVTAMRQVGFAAWLRTPGQGNWNWHVHGIAKGDPDLSSGASKQVTSYLAGRNGLKGNGDDDGPDGYRNNTWPAWLAANPNWKGLTVDQVEEIKQFVRAELKGLEQRIYAGPRYAALQTGITELIKELKSHDSEEDARYGYYAGKLNDILAEASKEDPKPPVVTPPKA